MSRRFIDSPYIRCQPLSQAKIRSMICYYCGRQTRRGAGTSAIDATSDHVLARAHYPNGSRPFDSDVPNRRPCCYFCNQHRARLGHCCGLLMMVLIEASHRGHAMDCFGHARRIIMPSGKAPWRQRKQNGVSARRILAGRLVHDALTYGV